MPATDIFSFVLPIDTYMARLKRWVECESPTWDREAVDRMMSLAEHDLGEAGAIVTRGAGRGGFAGILSATFPHPRQGEAGILILGHLDTVHPVGTLNLLPWRVDDGLCYGPGVADMKGGVCLAIETLTQMASIGVQSHLPVTLLLTGDEEVGSPTTRSIVEAFARKNRYVLVTEPGRADGSLVVGRHAVSRFKMTARGQPGHAGSLGPNRGASALREMAAKIIAAEELSNDDATCTVGTLATGRWSNCIPAHCEAEAVVVARSKIAMDEISRKLALLSSKIPLVEFYVEKGLSRPEWSPEGNSLALFAVAQRIGRRFGFNLESVVAGGGSDGNFTGSLGIATLDGLGPSGRMYHTVNEHILLETVPDRGRLLAGLLVELK